MLKHQSLVNVGAGSRLLPISCPHVKLRLHPPEGWARDSQREQEEAIVSEEPALAKHFSSSKGLVATWIQQVGPLGILSWLPRRLNYARGTAQELRFALDSTSTQYGGEPRVWLLFLRLYQEAWRWGTIPEPQLFGIVQMQTKAETQYEAGTQTVKPLRATSLKRLGSGTWG